MPCQLRSSKYNWRNEWGCQILSRSVLLVIAYASPALPSPSIIAQQSLDGRIAVALTLDYKGGEKHVVEISLKNKGEKVEVRFHKLPWGHEVSLRLILVTRKGEILRKVLIVDDPDLTSVELKPNQVLRGKISLSDRFASLDEALSEGDVDLFWSYQLQTTTGERARRVGGWMNIPQVKVAK